MNKKIVLLALIITSSFGAMAQMTGGGTEQNNTSVTRTASSGHKWGALVIALSNPMGKFKENNLRIPFDQAVGAKPGFYFGYEAANYFQESSNPFKVGLSTTVGLAINAVNWEKWVAGSTSFEGTPFVLGDLKLGAIGTYEIADKMRADGFLRLGVNYGVGGTGYWSGGDEFYSENFAVGFGTNFGANFRYDRLLATLQVSTGKLSFDYYEDFTGTTKTYKVPITSFRLGIGVIFGSGN